MTPDRLAHLRGLVERGELGSGPKTAELVAELLEDRDATARTLDAVEHRVRRCLEWHQAKRLGGMAPATETSGLSLGAALTIKRVISDARREA